MNGTSRPPAPPRARAFDTIVLGGLTAGVFDIIDAIVVTWLAGRAPTRMLQAIASGVLGPDAYAGGSITAALGLGLHFFIACGAATTYFVASRVLPSLLHRPLLYGTLFGLAVWAFMQHLVLPATFGRPSPVPPLPQLANQLTIHALGVGLPIALFASRSARRRAGRPSPTPG